MKYIVEVQGLTKHFPVEQGLTSIFSRRQNVIHAVCNVSLSIKKGEILGLVGESGSGKSTLAMCILLLLNPTSGRIYFKGHEITHLKSKEAKWVRRKMQVIFQDPYTSLNPRMKIGDIVSMPMKVHNIGNNEERRRRVEELLKDIGLSVDFIDRYPHQLSGGQRQRIAIARALSVKPELIIADEPTSGLDVSVQAQILRLFLEAQRHYGFSTLFISHDLGVVKYISDRVAVMYLGKIVEVGPSATIMTSSLHPYTRALISAFPEPDPEVKRKKIILKGEIPSSIDPPSGCRFRTRCPFTAEICKHEEPTPIEMNEGHWVACHFAGKI